MATYDVPPGLSIAELVSQFCSSPSSTEIGV